MKEGSRRAVQMRGTMQRVLRQNRFDAEDRSSRSLPLRGRSFLDALDQGSNPVLVSLIGEMPPAGKTREVDGLLLGVAEAVEGLSPAACSVLQATIEPVAGQRLAVENGSRRVEATWGRPYVAGPLG